MIGLAEYWWQILVIIGVIVVGAAIIFGERGLRAHAAAGQSGGGLMNAALAILGVALLAGAGADIISGGRLSSAALDLALTILTRN